MKINQLQKLFNITTDYKVTELFCIIDEFCKHFDAEHATNRYFIPNWDI